MPDFPLGILWTGGKYAFDKIANFPLFKRNKLTLKGCGIESKITQQNALDKFRQHAVIYLSNNYNNKTITGLEVKIVSVTNEETKKEIVLNSCVIGGDYINPKDDKRLIVCEHLNANKFLMEEDIEHFVAWNKSDSLELGYLQIGNYTFFAEPHLVKVRFSATDMAAKEEVFRIQLESDENIFKFEKI